MSHLGLSLKTKSLSEIRHNYSDLIEGKEKHKRQASDDSFCKKKFLYSLEESVLYCVICRELNTFLEWKPMAKKLVLIILTYLSAAKFDWDSLK